MDPETISSAFSQQFGSPDAIKAHPDMAPVHTDPLIPGIADEHQFRGDEATLRYANRVGDLYQQRLDQLGVTDPGGEHRASLEESLRKKAKDYALNTLQQRLQDAGKTGRTSAGYILKRMPFVGMGIPIAEAGDLAYTREKEATHSAGPREYLNLARHQAAEQADKEKTFGGQAFDIATQLPAAAVEWRATSGIGAAGRLAALRGTGAIIPNAIKAGAETPALGTLASIAGNAVIGAVGEGAARTATMSAPAALADYMRRTGETNTEAALHAVGSKLLENSIFSMGGVFHTDAERSLLRRVAGGLMSVEANREAQSELGFSPGSGTVRRLFGSPEERLQAIQDLGSDAVAISMLEGLIHAAVRSGAKPEMAAKGIQQKLLEHADAEYTTNPRYPGGGKPPDFQAGPIYTTPRRIASGGTVPKAPPREPQRQLPPGTGEPPLQLENRGGGSVQDAESEAVRQKLIENRGGRWRPDLPPERPGPGGIMSGPRVSNGARPSRMSMPPGGDYETPAAAADTEAGTLSPAASQEGQVAASQEGQVGGREDEAPAAGVGAQPVRGAVGAAGGPEGAAAAGGTPGPEAGAAPAQEVSTGERRPGNLRSDVGNAPGHPEGIGPYGFGLVSAMTEWKLHNEYLAKHPNADPEEAEAAVLRAIHAESGPWAVVVDSHHASAVGVHSRHGTEAEAHQAMMREKQRYDTTGLWFSVEHRPVTSEKGVTPSEPTATVATVDEPAQRTSPAPASDIEQAVASQLPPGHELLTKEGPRVGPADRAARMRAKQAGLAGVKANAGASDRPIKKSAGVKAVEEPVSREPLHITDTSREKLLNMLDDDAAREKETGEGLLTPREREVLFGRLRDEKSLEELSGKPGEITGVYRQVLEKAKAGKYKLSEEAVAKLESDIQDKLQREAEGRQVEDVNSRQSAAYVEKRALKKLGFEGTVQKLFDKEKAGQGIADRGDETTMGKVLKGKDVTPQELSLSDPHGQIHDSLSRRISAINDEIDSKTAKLQEGIDSGRLTRGIIQASKEHLAELRRTLDRMHDEGRSTPRVEAPAGGVSEEASGQRTEDVKPELNEEHLNHPEGHSSGDSVADWVRDFIRGESGTAYPAVLTAHAIHAAKVLYKAAKQGIVDIQDGIRMAGGAMVPKLSRMSAAVGDAVARKIAAPVYSREAAPHYIERVLGKPDPQSAKDYLLGAHSSWKNDHLWGTTLQEYRHRYAYQNLMAEAKKASNEAFDARQRGDKDVAKEMAQRATELGERARNIQSLVGQPGSPLKTEADYQRVFNDAEWKAGIERYAKEVVPILDENYRGSQGIAENDPIESLTQIPGLTVNAKAVFEGDPETPGIVGAGRGNLRGQQTRRSPFAQEAKLSHTAYDTRLSAMIQNSIIRSTTVARHAEMYRIAEDNGVGQWGKGGQHIEGYTEIPNVRPPLGTQAAERGEHSFYVKSDGYQEFRAALGNDQPLTIPYLTAGAKKLTLPAIATGAEATAHSINLLSTGVRAATTSGFVRSGIDFAKNFAGVLQKNPGLMQDYLELARIGSTKQHGFEASGYEKEGALGSMRVNPMYWSGRFLDLIDKTMRLTLSDAYERAMEQRGIEPTQGGKRDFVNQAGQYHALGQPRLMRWARDIGASPFITAGANFPIQGVRTMTGGSGAKADTAAQATKLRGVTLARLAGLLATIPLANYLAWQRMDGADDVPWGAIKYGETEDGRSQYIQALNWLGIERGMKLVGLHAMMEGKRRGWSSAKIKDRAVSEAVGTITQPFKGPAVGFAEMAITGKDAIGRQVAEKPKDKENDSQAYENIVAALWNINPMLAIALGKDTPQDEDLADLPNDRWWKVAGRAAFKEAPKQKTGGTTRRRSFIPGGR